MIINYLGANYIKVQVGDRVTAFDPIGKDSGLRTTRFGADLAFQSCRRPETVGADFVTKDNTFFVSGPGEYELGGSFVHGFSSRGPADQINTIYTFTDDGLKLCHLGFLADIELSPTAAEEVTGSDIIFLPIGGWGTISPAAAAKLAARLESKLVIPIAWGLAKEKDLLNVFAKEMGATVAPVDKLTVKKKDLENKEGELVVIASFND